ncbi:DMT family transporter [Acinetobacter sp. MB5]|uniref:DMT family transporter n=1 Tax=Acinetobacter sp. MB5 TaxID=2069438 RepID=UPI000DD04C19|nr:EamA family transporter [Acinetobacter sp. MB5]
MFLFKGSISVSHLSIYAILVLIWAATPLAIVWSVQEIDPLWILMIRYIGASILAYALLRIFRNPLPLDHRSLMSYVAGSLNLIGAQFFIYLAARYLTSGLMALLFGLSPLISGLIGHFVLKNQRLVSIQWFGMLMAVFGLIVVFADQTGNHVQPIGIGLILISIISYVSSIFWVKHIAAPLTPMSQATGSLLVSALASLLLLPSIYQHVPQHFPESKTLLGLAFTILCSSIIAMLCYFWLIRELKPVTISLSNVITPIIALSLGAILNHEQLNLSVLVGVIMIMTGIIFYLRQGPNKAY